MIMDIKIIELAPEEFINASFKNKYIADTVERYIGFVDNSAANAEEALTILEEYHPFDKKGCGVVVFGDRDLSGMSRTELILNCDVKIYGIVIDRKIFDGTGCFNVFLGNSCITEFLCRVCESVKILFIPCAAQNREVFDKAAAAKELAYIMCKYMTELKKNAELENTFNHVSRYAASGGFSGQLNNNLDMLLSNGETYDMISENTAPYLVLSGDGTCYGVLEKFAGELARALADIGQAVIVSDGSDAGTLRSTRFKGVIGFQSAALADTAFDWIKGRRLQFWFDHPAFFESMFKNFGKRDMVLCQDDDYAEYIKTYYGVPAVWFPPAGNCNGKPDFDNRKLDIVFVGTYCKPHEPEYEYEVQKRVYEYVADKPDSTVENALYELYGIEGRELHQVMKSMFHVRKNIADYYRHKVVETIISAGYKLNVYGDSWEEFQSEYADNLIIHPQVPADELMRVYEDAKVGLNVMTWHKSGMTERVADIMLAGAVCLSDKTKYLCENFNNDEIVLYNLDELEKLPEQLERLFGDEKYRLNTAMAGYKKALQFHTWRQRAKELCALTEDR